MKNQKIDFVIIWVDGNDPKWQRKKIQYSGNEISSRAVDDAIYRFRDWDNLKYLFRSIELYAPWVNKIHFVTEGHVPDWLDLDNKKLHFVKHSDYMPKEYLPTFSANPIELNLHRIEGLAEKFVYFNDDMFLLQPAKPEDFFVNGLPCDKAVLSRIVANDNKDVFPHMMLNVVGVLNQNFKKNDVVRRHLNQWFTTRYGINSLLKSLLFMPYSNFSGFAWTHLTSSFLKSTFVEVWDKEFDILDQTSRHKFRHIQDVNQYLIRGWQIAEGNFYPRDIERSGRAFFDPSKQADELYDSIKNRRYSMICINDGQIGDNFEKIKNDVIDSFEKIFPEKSSYEK